MELQHWQKHLCRQETVFLLLIKEKEDLTSITNSSGPKDALQAQPVCTWPSPACLTTWSNTTRTDDTTESVIDPVVGGEENNFCCERICMSQVYVMETRLCVSTSVPVASSWSHLSSWKPVRPRPRCLLPFPSLSPGAPCYTCREHREMFHQYNRPAVSKRAHWKSQENVLCYKTDDRLLNRL